MTKEQIKRIFDKVYNGQVNFMTPEIVDYRKRGNLLLEFSKGKFIDMYVYGATFLEISKDGYKKRDDLNKCVNNLDEALEILRKN